MKKSSFLSRLLLDWALLCIGVLGSVYCLTTADQFGLKMPVLVPFLVPILAMFLCLLFQGKTGKYYALGVLGLFLLCGWLFREDLTEGLRSLWAFLIEKYAGGYGYNWLSRLVPKEPCVPEAIGGGIVALAVAETYFCAISIRLWKRTTPAALSILPGVAACFVLTNTLPARLPMLAVAFSILAQAFSQSSRRRQTGEHSMAVLWAALLSAALLGLLLLFLPDQKDFKSPITWDELSEKLEHWGEQQSNMGNVDAGLIGNPNEVDLSRLTDLPERPIPKLYVTSAKTAYLYLRGSSYMEFDGSSWGRGPLWEGAVNAAFPYLSRNDGANLAIETRDSEPTLYTSYQLTALPDSGAGVGDAYVENTEAVQRYTMRFLENPDPVAADAAYDAWVRENCLSVPEKTRTAVLDWWEENGADVEQPLALRWADDVRDQISVISADGEVGFSLNVNDFFTAKQIAEQTTEFAQRVADEVSRTASYSRKPARVPEGKDFCEWFLNEAEEGYCVHYATACTALLRALGIPARYVSGYVCQAQSGERTRVTNLQNHAWVEIWNQGRWVVVEPTPDDATEFSGLLDPNGEDAGASTEAAATESETVPPPPVTKPLPTESEEASEDVPTETTEPRPTEPNTPNGPNSNNHNRGINPKELTGLWVFGALLLILVRRRLVLRLRERRLRRAKPNERARLFYRYILRLQKLIDNNIPPEVTELAQKAAYSQHELDDKELAFLRQIYEQQKNRAAISGFWRRFWCKYVLAII